VLVEWGGLFSVGEREEEREGLDGTVVAIDDNGGVVVVASVGEGKESDDVILRFH